MDALLLRSPGVPTGMQPPKGAPLQLGRYEVILPIASGGMATVYLARARGAAGFQRDVAIKLTHSHLLEHTEFVTGLLEEANLVARIKHPNVVPVLDVGEDPEGVFLAMEYVEGDSLSGLVRRLRGIGQKLGVGHGLRILCDALQGLHAAHELRGDDGSRLELVHRDFSPQNILVGLDGAARLTDFGIAKAASRLGQTRTGVVKGKVSFMAPEQIKPKRALDRRADIWAAGVLAWEIVAGRRLYPIDGDEIAVLFRIVEDEVPSLAEFAPHAPPALVAAIHSALRHDPAERPATAAAFRAALIEACRGSSVPLVEHEEVAELMQQVVEPAMDERRRRARQIVESRVTRQGNLTDAIPPAFGPTPSGIVVPPPPPSVPSQGTPISLNIPFTPPREIMPIEATMLTDTSSVGDAPFPGQSSRKLVIAAALTAAVTIGVMVGILTWVRSSSRNESEVAAGSAAPERANAGAPASIEPSVTAVETPTASEPAPTVVPSPSASAEVAHAAPSSSATAAKSSSVAASAPSAPKTATPASKSSSQASPLATTPYKTGGPGKR
ncbi:MAG: serine/threonine protein kinase [Polyangiaceae bacterium]|nr:serine/threonine protein kinase [Polyangiaceae bacterium]